MEVAAPATEETETDTQKLMGQVVNMDTKIITLESKFGALQDVVQGRIQDLESKLDQILALLTSLGGNGTGTTSIVAAST